MIFLIYLDKIDINAKDHDENSILHYASQSGNLQLVQYIINLNKIDVTDKIKPKIMQKITQNGTLKSIKRKVKIGMMIAVEEIKNEST